MSQGDAKHKPPPKPRLGQAKPTASGLKIVEVAPQSGVKYPTPPPPPPMPGELEILVDTEDIDSEVIPPPPAQNDPYLGCTIDSRYKVESILGEGGMGVVYKCRHKIIDKKVAMKILRADLARDKEVTERFLIEAKAASSIGNEHIIDISDFGQLPDGSAYFVMEFLEGIPLSGAIPAGEPMPTERILSVGMQLCEGLAAAHKANIVHRDLKPDNIYLVNRGKEAEFVKILDFGIAKVSTNATGKLTQAGSVFGTPHYMSPEQAAGAPVDHRGDIYSLGVILYELASGRVPFDADNFMGILTQHMYKAPDRLTSATSTLEDSISPSLEAIILKCLSKRPEQRYQAMPILRQELQLLHDGKVPAAVDELLARSGGFNVPADFFNKRSASSAPVVPPLTEKKTRWGLWLGLILPSAAATAVYLSQNPALLDRARELVLGERQRTETTPVAAPTATGVADEELTLARQVLLGIEPAEAHAFLGEEDLGANPVLINVPDGEVLSLEVRHRGYKSATVIIDGSEGKQAVSLIPLRKKWRAPRATKAGAGTTTAAKPKRKSRTKKVKRPVGGVEIVNPWD